MTLEQFYIEIGGDYADTLARLRKPERIEKYLGKFLEDQNFDLFLRSMEAGNGANAFLAIHTLKGISQTLGLTALYKSACKVTDALRQGEMPAAKELTPQVASCYQTVTAAIGNLIREHGV